MATGGLYGSTATAVPVTSDTDGLYGSGSFYGGTFFEWFIFQQSNTQPTTPTGGTWSFTTSTGTPPTGWSNTPPSNPTGLVWVSIAFVNSITTSYTWSAPALWFEQGTAGQVAVGTTTTLSAGSPATVNNSGTAYNAVLNFGIPQGIQGATGATGPTGPTGPTGATGAAATIAVGTTTTLASGSPATVSNSGSSSAATFNFGIPQGIPGNAATIAVGTTTTTAPGTSATVTNTGTSNAAVFNFGIPKGAGVAAGGTTSQALIKNSNADYDTTWATITGVLSYQGTWNANTNTPTLTSSVGTNGYYYIVSVGGTTNLNGITDWQPNDWVIFNGTSWEKIDNSDLVTSVNGYTGAVVLTNTDVGAPTYTGTGASGTWGINVTGNAGTVTNGVYTTGSYSNPAWITSLAGSKVTAIPNSSLTNSSITINGTPISLGGSTSVGTVTSVSGTAPIVSSGGNTPAISITQASGSTNGYLSSTDWTTFNNKGSGSVTSVSGTGTVNGITLTGTVTSSGSLTLGGTLGGIGNSQLINSTISGVALGSNLNALTIGTGLSGTSYNGSAAVTIANTAPMVYPGAGIPNSTGSAWGTSYSVTGSNKVVLSTAPTFDTYTAYTPIAQPSYTEGLMWYDSTQKALSYFNDVSGNVITIGQETQVKVKNGTGSTIAAGIAVYVTSTSSGAIYPLVAPAQANSLSTSAVIGLTTQSIASGAVGYVTTAGLLTPVNTGTFTVGDVLYLSPYSAGQIQNTVPPTGYPVQIGVVAYANTPSGSIYVKQTTPLAVSTSTLVGQVSVPNGGTGAATLTGYVYGNGISAMTASTTIPTTALSGTITNGQLANSSITINGTPISLGGSVTTPSGTVTSVSGTGTVNGITLTGTVTSSGSLTLGGTLSSIANTQLVNSSITFGATAYALGSTVSNINGVSIGGGTF